MRHSRRAGGSPGIDGGAERDSPRRTRTQLTPVRIVLTVGLLALMVWTLVELLHSEPRRSGTNLTQNTGFVIPLAARQELCVPGELVPGDTGALRLSASSGSSPGPRLAVHVSDGSGTVSSGALAPGWRSGVVLIRLTPIAHTLAGTVCVSNLGDRPIAFGGSAPDANFYVAIAGKPLSGRLRIEYMRPGSESWLALLPTLAHRFSLAKSDLVRHWAPFAAIVLMLLAVGLTTRTMLKAKESR